MILGKYDGDGEEYFIISCLATLAVVRITHC